MRLPVKAALRLVWQRSVLTVRYLFRLPIDGIREHHREVLDNKVAEQLRRQARAISQLNARLAWYEHQVPSLQRARRAWVAKETRERKKDGAKRDEYHRLVIEGVSEAEARDRVWGKET